MIPSINDAQLPKYAPYCPLVANANRSLFHLRNNFCVCVGDMHFLQYLLMILMLRWLFFILVCEGKVIISALVLNPFTLWFWVSLFILLVFNFACHGDYFPWLQHDLLALVVLSLFRITVIFFFFLLLLFLTLGPFTFILFSSCLAVLSCSILHMQHLIPS